ncbi:MAG TPA: mycofactocin biosynthesis peptidyl-dipeptidase MftE [Solirubrobacteraceae bacterium]|nr:mycofactocin biosynthesis peptidyl-dipeptidase MftE [Solirubrobacteraceae bacterium]
MSALDRAAWPDLGGARLLIVPVGATEQHGPHLPLSTDTDIAQALGTRLAAALPGACLAPALPYGASGEHQAFPGTLSIGSSATAQVLLELGRSSTETFARVLFICAHGGNAEALSGAVGKLCAEGRDVRAWSPRWSGDAHAGHLETSLMLAIAPERVRLERAQIGNPAPLAELMPVMRAEGVRAVSANGVLGDPAQASAEHGRALLAAEHERITRMVREWLR